MFDSAIGLIILLVAVLPGAAYTWGFERQAGSFRVSLADRTLRFVGASVLFHLALAPLNWLLYRLLVPFGRAVDGGDFLLLWAAVGVLTFLPYAVGNAVGGLYRSRHARDTSWRWARRFLTRQREERLLRALLGHDPAPRAWDHLFAPRPNGFVRVRLIDGVWIAGKFADRSYAGGYPNQPDLLLEEAWSLDSPDGSLGEQGLGYPLYVSASQISWLEMIETTQADGVPGEEGD